MRAVLTKGRIRCRSTIGALAVAALALPAGSAAEFGVPGECQADGFMPVPAATVQNGVQKDKNGNGFVCAKFADGKLVGGPDDDAIL
jgi:hypothetical protein